MRFDPALPIAAVALWLPPRRETVAEAIAAGRLDPEVAAENGYLAVTVSGLAAPEMAVLAASAAIAQAQWDPATVGLVVHAWTYYQGHDFWSPAHFVAHGIGARRAIPIGVQQMCNGGAAAIEVAATRVLADPAVARAVVTTADRFAPPAYDRWSGDRGAAYGDAATALLLARPDPPAREHPAPDPPARGRPTFHNTARGRPTFRNRSVVPPLWLLAAASVAAPELEAMHRGDDPFGPAPHSVHWTVRSHRTVQQFFAAGGKPLVDDLACEAVHAVLADALAQARLDGDDPRLRLVALPRLGRPVLGSAFRAVIPSHTRAEIVDFGRDTGHLGAGDAAANLAAIHAGGLLAPGEIAILLSVGAGFTWSAIVVQAAGCPVTRAAG